MEALGALRRPTAFILMNPAASIFASVRVRLGCARPVICTSSATDLGLRSRMMARSRRFSGVKRRDGLDRIEAGLAGARRSPPLPAGHRSHLPFERIQVLDFVLLHVSANSYFTS